MRLKLSKSDKRKLKPQEVKEMASTARFLEGLLVGGALGFLSGILLAPKSGADLRKQLSDSSEDLYQQAQDSLTGLKEMTNQTFQDVQHVGQDVVRKASDTLNGTKEHLAQKIEDFTGKGPNVLVDDME
jgi:gas vesicle protein